jgi:methyl-accepting chemotaxis protein
VNLLNNTKIPVKIAAIVVALSLISIGFVVHLTGAMKQLNGKAGELLTHTSEGQLAASRAMLRLSQMGYQAGRVITEDGATPVAVAAAKGHAVVVTEFKDFVSKARAHLPMHSAALADFNQMGEAIEKQTGIAIAAGLKNEDAAAKQAMHVADELITKAMEHARTLYRNMGEGAQKDSDALKAEVDATSLLMLILGVVAGIFGVGTALVVASKGITGPLARLQGRMRELADGKLEAEVAGQDRRDEVGQMAKALLVFRDNALTARALEAEATAGRGAADAERARNESERAAAAAELARVMEDVAGALNGLAKGDLTCRLARLPGDYSRIETDFNAALTGLQETMRGIATSAQTIHMGTGEIGHAADDLSRRTEQQAASLEETAAALDEITATVKKTAEGSKHAREVVASARDDAEKSGVVVQEAVTAMSAIEASSKEIANIIGVIDEIAFQTNLLALNAGVEAARAGDAGKGFAVVASEVRALAQRSAEAAKEIKTLISASSTHVASGVTLVSETGKALT